MAARRLVAVIGAPHHSAPAPTTTVQVRDELPLMSDDYGTRQREMSADMDRQAGKGMKQGSSGGTKRGSNLSAEGRLSPPRQDEVEVEAEVEVHDAEVRSINVTVTRTLPDLKSVGRKEGGSVAHG